MRLEAVRKLWERLKDRGPKVLDDPGSFTSSELEAGRMVLPLLQDLQSVRKVIDDLTRRTQALEIALDHLPVAAIVVDDSGRYLTENAAAQKLFGGVAVPEAILTAAHAGSTEKRAILVKVGSATVRIVSGEPRSVSVPAADGLPRILFLVPADGSLELSTDHLRERYDLTPAQGRVAALVALGLTNKEIALRLEVASDTIHKHLAALFQKTGISTRAGLVTLAFAARFGVDLAPPS